MRSFEIFVAPKLETPRFDPEPAESAAVSSSDDLADGDDVAARPRLSLARAPRPAARGTAREALDVFVDGANLTARFTERDATCVLRDLALALVQLGKQERGKGIVHFNEDAWELAVERDGARAWISVYRGGPLPQITAYDRPVVFADVVASAREAAELARLRHPRDLDLREACVALTLLDPADFTAPPAALTAQEVRLDLEDDAALSLGCEFALRPGREAPAGEVERADLHALLFRGKLRASARGRTVTLGVAHPFLFAERFLDLAARALETAEREEELNLRFEGGGVVMGIRSSGANGGLVALSFGEPGAPGSCTFPSLAAHDLLEAALTFGQRLVRALVRRDRAQASNLRLGAFRRRLRDLVNAFHESRLEDVKVNPRPEAYRPGRRVDATAVPLASRRSETSAAPLPTSAPARLRYSPRWRALVPASICAAPSSSATASSSARPANRSASIAPPATCSGASPPAAPPACSPPAASLASTPTARSTCTTSATARSPCAPRSAPASALRPRVWWSTAPVSPACSSSPRGSATWWPSISRTDRLAGARRTPLRHVAPPAALRARSV